MQNDKVTPAIAEIILIDDAERRLRFVGERQILEADLGCLEGTRSIQFIVIELRGANCESSDVELVKVAIGPAKGGLQHFMQLREVELDRQFKGAADPRLDADDVDIGGDDKGVGIEGVKHE